MANSYQCKICNELKTAHGLCSHIFKAHKMKLREYYDIYYASESKTCSICNIDTDFINAQLGYKKYCKSCNQKIIMPAKVKATKLLNHGAENFNNLRKAKLTKLERYGNANYNNSDKIHKTMNELYGGYTLQSANLKEKVAATKLEKYNNPYYNNTLKSKITCKLKYGVTHYNKTNEARQNTSDRMKATSDYGFASDNYKNSILEKYGVNNVSQNASVRKYIELSRQATIYDRFYVNNKFCTVTPLFKSDEYTNVQETYKFQCNKCNTIFDSNLINGKIPRCFTCYPALHNTSIGEIEILNFIKSLNINVISNSKQILPSKKELDIFIPELNIAIEYNGLYWHSEIKNSNRSRHLEKLIECESIGIKLIQIWEDDWIYIQHVIKERLTSILKKNSVKLHARKCTIKEISTYEKDEFLFNTHLQGIDKSSVKLGAYYNDELVAVMTFGSLRRALGSKAAKDEYELYRYASKYQINGIASKLLSHFIKLYNPKKIITFANRCWTNTTTNLYTKLGFTYVCASTPSYWYFKGAGKKVHRYSFRKNVLSKKLPIFDATLTEWQNMQLNGYNRVWDCGNLKYEIVL